MKNNLDKDFLRGSALTGFRIFCEELEGNFATWQNIPSRSLAQRMFVWRALGSVSKSAEAFRISKLYSDHGWLDCLPEEISGAGNEDAWGKYKTVGQKIGMWTKPLSESGSRTKPNGQASEFTDLVVSQVKAQLQAQGELPWLPAIRLGVGGAVYLNVSKPDDGARFFLILKHAGIELNSALHNGSHGIVAGCGADGFSDKNVSVTAGEIVRHVKMLSTLIPPSSGNQ